MARSDVGRERITVYRYFEGIDFTDLADTISAEVERIRGRRRSELVDVLTQLLDRAEH